MTGGIEELLGEVRAAGASLRADGDKLKIVPAGKLPEELKIRLRERKVELLHLLELEASTRCLEAANISIAIFDDGSMRVIENGQEARQSAKAGGTVYTPADMWHYVQLEPHERRLLHGFKKQFGGATEWRKA
jgi:hypothetical protein